VKYFSPAKVTVKWMRQEPDIIEESGYNVIPDITNSIQELKLKIDPVIMSKWQHL